LFKKYKIWKGSRKDLINEIIYLENENPDKFRMISKKSGNYIDVNIRRIQQFIDVSILPKPHVIKKQYEYTREHLLRYLAAIVLKNNDHTIKQIEKILSTLDIDQVEEQILTKDSKNLKLNKMLFEEKDKINLSSELKKLGREEGKVLRSQWLKFAITKWCNFEIKKNKLKGLQENEINTIIHAFENSLRETIEIVSKNELENKIT
jgi:DNA-binding transcriptional MerR regulator